MQQDYVELVIDISEDYSSQIYWLDDFNQPMEIIAPCQMDVKDSEGTVVMSFKTGNDSATEPTITLGGAGYMMITVPRTVTATLVAGTYLTDLFATVDTTGFPDGQWTKVFSGTVIAMPSTTVVEA